MKELLRLAEEGGGSCAEALAVGLSQLANIPAKTGDLRGMEQALEHMVARCADGARPDCPLIETWCDAATAARSADDSAFLGR